MNFSKSALLMALVSGALFPAPLVWKVKAFNTPATNRQASVHGNMTDRGVDLIQLLDPSNTHVWEGARDLLWLNSGTLDNDGNSHGNRLIFGERGADMGESTPGDETDELLKDGLNYNGGPFYRYWTRLFEAHSRMDALVPTSKRRYPISQSGEEVYRYWGHLAHLTQDNCSPTHAANIRHGFNDGVEWHHWGSANGEGGTGRSIPLPKEELINRMQTFGLVGKVDFFDFFKMNQKTIIPFANVEKFKVDRGFKLADNLGQTMDKRNPVRRTIDGFLERVIQDTKRWMIKVDVMQSSDPARYENYIAIFRSWYTAGGKRPTETQIKKIYDYSYDDDYPLDPAKIADGISSLWSGRQEGARILQDLYHQRPFFNRKPLASGEDPLQPSSEGFYVGYAHGLIYPKKDKDQGGEWLDFNQDTTPWHPNPAYKGGAFDSHWGSYGGRWGFPGRRSYSDIGSAVGDAVTSASSKIVPGDLYLMHVSADYLPYHPFNKGFFADYEDERDRAYVLPLGPTLEFVGNEQIDRGAMWSASLLEAVSKFLPPVIQDLEVTPRNAQPGNPLPDTSGFRIMAANRGANFDVSLLFQRTDEYQIEFYAIPRPMFFKGNQADHWNRKLSVGAPGGAELGSSSSLLTHELWPSDLTRDQVIPASGNSPGDTVPYVYFKRSYDFVYSNLPMFPLRVKAASQVGGTITERDFNLSTPTVEADYKPIPVTVVPVINPGGDSSAGSYKYSAAARFVWNGEVGMPTYLFKGPIPEKDPDFASMKTFTDPAESKTVLAQGDYFILMIAYRKGAREAFANNQYKLLQNFKKGIETLAWWEKEKSSMDWILKNTSLGPLGTMPMGWSGATIPEDKRVKIPDELYLIRIDSKPIK